MALTAVASPCCTSFMALTAVASPCCTLLDTHLPSTPLSFHSAIRNEIPRKTPNEIPRKTDSTNQGVLGNFARSPQSRRVVAVRRTKSKEGRAVTVKLSSADGKPGVGTQGVNAYRLEGRRVERTHPLLGSKDSAECEPSEELTLCPVGIL